MRRPPQIPSPLAARRTPRNLPKRRPPRVVTRNRNALGRVRFDGLSVDKMISLSKSLGAELGLQVDTLYYPSINAQFVADIWSLQVIALWVTDGNCFAQYGAKGSYKGTPGIVTRNGHDPKDLAKVLTPSGEASKNLRDVLGSEVYGPDGIFGVQTESILLSLAAETKRANNGQLDKIQKFRIFGKDIPVSAASRAGELLTFLIRGVTTRKIKAEIDTFSGTTAAPAFCDELSAAAAAVANCVVRKTPGGDARTPYKTKSDSSDKDSEKGGLGWKGWTAIGGGALLVGWLVMRDKGDKNKSSVV